jgi:uncharacterized membrane protein
MDDADQLKQEVAALAERLNVLEAEVGRLSGGTVSTVSAPGPTASPRLPQHRHRMPALFSASSEGRSLENRIGSQLFNRIGIIALFAGVAWFFKFAVENGWLSPFMRILLGLVAGSAIMLWSERFRRRGYSGFSFTLKAVGTGVLYLTLWAAFSLYHFVPAGVAFVGMAIVTLLNAWLALIEDAELLAFYALAGGFATPLLLSTGVDHEIFLFSYLLLLNAAMFVLFARRPWTRLLVVAYPGTVFYAVAWYFAHFDKSKLGMTLFFAALFWILFAVAPPVLRRVTRANSAVPPLQNVWVSTVLPLVHAAIAFVFFCALLDSQLAPSTQAQAWTALIFAASYLLLMLATRTDSAHLQAIAVNATLSVAFLTLFIPLYFTGRAIIYGWLAEGLVLVLLVRRFRTGYASALAAAPLLFAFCDLLGYDNINNAVPQTVVLNARFSAYVAAIIVFITAAVITRDQAEWSHFRSGAIPAVNLLALIAVSREIQTYWHGSPTLFAERFSYSIWFMIYGAVLLLAGFSRNSAFLRWQGLALLAFTIAKVFLYDMANLSQGYRVLSLLGLGALLLGVSFAYQRDWLRLRQQG